MIYPTTEELSAVQKAVQLVEGALKDVSGIIHEQELKVFLASSHRYSLRNNKTFLKQSKPKQLKT